ncbi:hypothetical protein V8C34DRAFT_159 [Trichoderma compactum]
MVTVHTSFQSQRYLWKRKSNPHIACYCHLIAPLLDLSVCLGPFFSFSLFFGMEWIGIMEENLGFSLGCLANSRLCIKRRRLCVRYIYFDLHGITRKHWNGWRPDSIQMLDSFVLLC